MVDLFAAAAASSLADGAPLAERLRPTRLADVVGQAHLLAPGKPVERLARASRLPSIILWGPPGTGKTTIARLIATERADQFVPLSAVTATVKDIRETVAAAESRLGMHQQRTVVFLDEIHRFTRTQQDALLPAVESGLISLIGATTESPWATIVGPLLSRCTVFRLEPLEVEDQRTLITRAEAATGATVEPAAVDALLASAGADGRKLLTTVEVAIALAGDQPVGVDHVRAAFGAGDLRYGRGAHYDGASAFIKHMRAGNEVQALAWLVRMLDGGEDPRFLARRMMIFASEDIGPADDRALMVAEAASRALDQVGLPEARYNLAHAARYLALAPKSRAVVDALAVAADIEPLVPTEGAHE